MTGILDKLLPRAPRTTERLVDTVYVILGDGSTWVRTPRRGWVATRSPVQGCSKPLIDESHLPRKAFRHKGGGYR